MVNQLYKLITILSVLLILISCNSNKIDQSSMFNGRSHKAKKRGIYDAGMNRKEAYKTPPSIATKKEYDKLSKYDTNPKKGARKANKELEKKKRKATKVRSKYNKKRHVKLKTTKGKTAGDK